MSLCYLPADCLTIIAKKMDKPLTLMGCCRYTLNNLWKNIQNRENILQNLWKRCSFQISQSSLIEQEIPTIEKFDRLISSLDQELFELLSTHPNFNWIDVERTLDSTSLQNTLERKIRLIEDLNLIQMVKNIPEISHWICNLHSETISVQAEELRSLLQQRADAARHVERINLASKGLTCIPKELSLFTGLIDLNIERNHLRQIPAHIFDGLIHLRTICLANNPIKELPDYLFAHLTKLERIFLYKTDLEKLPEHIFQGCENLLMIQLSSNVIDTLPEELLFSCVKLKEFHINHNKLRSLRASLFQTCINLEQASFQNNRLNDLPRELFDRCRKLDTACFWNNPLRESAKTCLSHHPCKRFFFEE